MFRHLFRLYLLGPGCCVPFSSIFIYSHPMPSRKRCRKIINATIFQWDLTRLFFGEGSSSKWVKKIRLLLTFPSSLFLIFRNTEQFFPSLGAAGLRRTWRVALVLSCCGCAAVLPRFGDFLAVFGAVANSVCAMATAGAVRVDGGMRMMYTIYYHIYIYTYIYIYHTHTYIYIHMIKYVYAIHDIL